MYNFITILSISVLFFCGFAQAKDFVVDCDKCVIEVSFTDDEVNRFKQEMGEENFYVVADDANYYACTLREYLEINGIELKYVTRLTSHHIKLIFPNANIDITKLKWLYEYYLYQKGKKPHKLMNISAPEDEINKYFDILLDIILTMNYHQWMINL